MLFKCQTKKKTETVKDVEERSNLNQIAIDAIIEDGLSFGIFRRKGMSKLLNRIKPGYKGPHRHTAKRVIKKRFYNTRVCFKDKFKNIAKIALTSDMWKSNTKNHHLTLTGHCFNKKFELKSSVLGFKSVSGRHTASNIRNYIDHELKNLEIKDKIAGITTDNASDIKKAVIGINVTCGCLCHILNLTVQNGLCLWTNLKLVTNDFYCWSA